MLLSDFDFELPSDLIAQQPLVDRSASRMLVVDRGAESFTDNSFCDLPNFLRSGDLVVVNNTKVFPARLLGRSETGAKIEIFLVSPLGDNAWQTLARPGRRLTVGRKIEFDHGLVAEVLEKLDGGQIIVSFTSADDLDSVVDLIGRTPLPPYIERDPAADDVDRERYQTMFASKRGAIAAPTAGLHFTPDVVDKIREVGADITEITLHVGYGTFEPIKVSELSQHRVAPEEYEISENAEAIIEETRMKGGRIIAVGTTTTRALENTMSIHASIRSGRYTADTTVTPGFQFKIVDALVTNFHLPKSSLLVLTSTFTGHELIMRAYRHAVAAKYRFYSYGDCMLII